jgi:23S rRNA (cytosine1962-C5)-methyltransferase
MIKQKQIQVEQKYVKQYKNGYPLITKEAVPQSMNVDDGTVVKLLDTQNHFICKGYIGKQNKGNGWVLTFSEDEEIDVQFFEKKLKTAFQQRSHLLNDSNTTAFRLFNGEGDGIGGLTIDYFDGFLLINWYSEGIYSFKASILQAITQSIDFKGIYEKKRFATNGTYVEDDDFVVGDRATFPLIVKENGVNFAIYLNEGAMVGVFLDQREVRKKIRDQYADGKSVLNTFSYTGAFSVFAALGGAKNTTSVDLAKRSLPKTKEQFEINAIKSEEQRIVVMDVFDYFKYAAKKGLKFDLVILDPPSFARSKKRTFSAGKDYKNLLKETIDITEKNGVIIASTNCSTFNMRTFKGFIDKAYKEKNTRYEIVEEFSLPEDFKTDRQYNEGNYLKVVFIKQK